jgi:hypothetical protein
MTELEPCPFCGGEAEFERMGDHRQSCIVACQDCGCRLETGETWNCGQSWNTRTPPPITEDMVERIERLFDTWYPDYRRLHQTTRAEIHEQIKAALGGNDASK